MIKPIPIEKLKHFMWHEGDEVVVPEEPPLPLASETGDWKYILLPIADTYPKGVHAVQEESKKDLNTTQPLFPCSDGSEVYRPLTFQENIEARVNEYNRLPTDNPDERKRLFNKFLDSCTGIVYKKGTSKFRIIHQLEPLITVASDYGGAFISANYDDFAGMGVELDNSETAYNEFLTKNQVVNHPAWLAAVEEDQNLLQEYTGIVFSELGKDRAMSFWIRTSVEQDYIRPLFVYYLDDYSYAISSSNIYDGASFLRVTQSRVGDER